MTASHIAVAILSDLWYSFCEPLGSLLYIMIFSTTIILQEPWWLGYCLFAFANLIIRYLFSLRNLLYLIKSANNFAHKSWRDLTRLYNNLTVCIHINTKRSRQLGMGKRVGGQFFRMFRIRKLLTCYKSVAKIFLRFQGVSQRRLFPLQTDNMPYKWKSLILRHFQELSTTKIYMKTN